MRTLIVRAAVAMVLVPVAASAQSLSLTESEALARLSPDSPRVQAIRASVDVARADAQAAARWPNPRLVVNRESSAGITEYISTIGQVLPITGRRGLAVSAASARADGISSRADEEIRRARADVRLAFADLVAEQSRESELRVAVARVREVAAAIAKREAAGDAAGFDRLRAEREALNVEADGSAVAVARATARAALTAFFADPGARRSSPFLRHAPEPPCPPLTNSWHARRRAVANCARSSRRSRALNSRSRPRPVASIPSRRSSPAPSPPAWESSAACSPST